MIRSVAPECVPTFQKSMPQPGRSGWTRHPFVDRATMARTFSTIRSSASDRRGPSPPRHRGRLQRGRHAEDDSGSRPWRPRRSRGFGRRGGLSAAWVRAEPRADARQHARTL